MFEFITYGAERLQLLLLIILRASGLFIMAPVLGHQNVPQLAKVGMVVLLSLLLSSTLAPASHLEINSLWQLAMVAVRELLVGLIIGLCFRLLFHAVQTAGGIVGYQMGLAIATAYDPNSGDQVSILGQFWLLVAILVFLAVDGHHAVIRAFADSYTVMPAGAMVLNGSAAELIIKYTAYVFVIALKLGAPVLVTLFLVDVALGTVAKTMPTMNVFFVGFPLKIAIGLVVVGVSLPVFSWVLRQSLGFLDRELRDIYVVMGGA